MSAGKNKALGRGLEALFSENTFDQQEKQESREYVLELPLGQIDTNKDQPRKTFRDETLRELADSIEANGLVQPITVQQKGGRYEIVAGERRFRACRLLGKETIPAIVKEISPRQVVELSLIENLQREDLNPIEEAAAIDALMQEFRLTQEQLSRQLGRSRPAIANSLRLLGLASGVKAEIIGGKLSAGHGRALAVLEQKQQEQLAREAIAGEWSVRELEKRLHDLQKPKQGKKPPQRQIELEEAESALRSHFGTKVKIQGTEKRGKIEIQYFSREDLERILQLTEES